MKIKALLISLALATTLLAGCGAKQAAPAPAPAPATPAKTDTSSAPATPAKTDAVTSASITNDPAVFAQSIGKDGKWIIAINKDVTVDKDLVLEGDFKNEKGAVQRKIALYNQDAKYVVTARYTLTAPKITINSPMASIEHGIFKGDIYVETNDFKLIDNKVIGNIYFATDAAKAGFKMDAKSSVSGVQEVKK
jgi:hypothetical protein